MIIIVDKNELTGRVGEFAKQLPLDEIDVFELIDNQKVTMEAVRMANLFIVTDYTNAEFRVMKHRYDPDVYGIYPMFMLERAIIKPFIDMELKNVSG